MVRQTDDVLSGEEPTEEEAMEAAFEGERLRLQRQLRVMENDRRSYTLETQNVIRKQMYLIDGLRQENKELTTVLRLAESDQNAIMDENNTVILNKLIECMEGYKDESKKEEKKIADLDAQIRRTEKEIINQRRILGGDTGEPTQKMVQKKTRVLENRLNLSQVKFNEQLAMNRKLREEIDNSREEKSRLDAIFQKLDKELQHLRKESNQFIEEASQSYEQRDEAYSKMTALKERSEKDKTQHKLELKELQRIIDHDDKLRQFMMMKASDRADLKEEEEAKKKKIKGDGGLGVETALIETYEEAFEEIKKITDKDDIQVITADFLHKENENFALFNFVNELNNEVEQLHEDITTTNDEIVRFEKDDIKMDAEQKYLYRDFKLQCREAKAETKELNKQILECSRVIEQLTEGVGSIFDCLMCDRSQLDEILGCEDDVTDTNILLYMGIIEQRTMDLLHIKHYIDMKKADPEKESKDARNKETTADVIKDKIPSIPHISIKAPTIGEEEEGADEDQDLRPLCYNELRYIVRRKMSKDCDGCQSTSPVKISPMSRTSGESPMTSISR